MTDYTTNYMSNTARMLGYTMGGTRSHLDNLRHIIESIKLSNVDRERLMYSVKCLEKKQAIIDLWWKKRDQEGVTVEALEAEINGKNLADIVELERA